MNQDSGGDHVGTAAATPVINPGIALRVIFPLFLATLLIRERLTVEFSVSRSEAGRLRQRVVEQDGLGAETGSEAVAEP
jgi:hypothetical protein